MSLSSRTHLRRASAHASSRLLFEAQRLLSRSLPRARCRARGIAHAADSHGLSRDKPQGRKTARKATSSDATALRPAATPRPHDHFFFLLLPLPDPDLLAFAGVAAAFATLGIFAGAAGARVSAVATSFAIFSSRARALLRAPVPSRPSSRPPQQPASSPSLRASPPSPIVAHLSGSTSADVASSSRNSGRVHVIYQRCRSVEVHARTQALARERCQHDRTATILRIASAQRVAKRVLDHPRQSPARPHGFRLDRPEQRIVESNCGPHKRHHPRR